MEKFIIIVYFLINPNDINNPNVIKYQIEQEVVSEIKCIQMAKDIFNYAKLSNVMTLETQCLTSYEN